MQKEFPSEYQPEPARIRGALDNVFKNSLRPVSLGLGILYALFTASHYFVLPEYAVWPMTIIAGITAITLLFTAWQVQYSDLSATGAYLIGAGIIILLLINTLFHLVLLEDVKQTTNIVIILIGQGFFLLATGWYYSILFVTVVSWGAVIQLIPASPEVTHYAFALASGVLLSVLLHHLRVKGLTRLYSSTFAEEYHKEKLAETVTELRKSETRARAMSDAAFEGIVFSEDDLIIDANQNVCTIFGMNLEEIVGKAIPDLIAPGDRDKVRENITNRYEEPYEVKAVRADGDEFPLEVHEKYMEYRDQQIRVTALRDLTSQRHMEEDARKFSRAIEQSISVVLITDTEARIEYVNPAFTKLTGYTFEEVRGKNPSILKSGETPESVYEELWEALKNGGTWRGEFINEKKNGEKFWEAATITPVTGSDGNITHYIAIKEDITQLKKTTQRLKEAKEAAEEANRIKSEFLASMSHELRTPLNSVIGFSNILLKNKDDTLTDKQMTYLERIKNNGTHLLELINDVLDLSKIEAHKMTVSKSQVNIKDLILEVAHQLSGQVSEDLELVTSLPDTVQIIETDPRKIKQILINLAGNAIKFTDTGTVEIALKVDENSWPEQLVVSDTGIGIPEEKLDTIFQAFQQIESGTSRNYQGTGLGLAITSSLCELLGFRVEVESIVGEGTTFTISLGGLKEGTGAVLPEQAIGTDLDVAVEPGETNAGDQVVLIIDDDTDSRVLLSHYVQEFGCEVISAGSGTQGLELAAKIHPDMILLDLIMDQMSGFDVLKKIRRDTGLSDVPVVITSIVASENRQNLLGAVDFLDKPVSRRQLLQLLRKHLKAQKTSVLIVDDDPGMRELLADFLQDEPVSLHTAVDGNDAFRVLEQVPVDLILLDIVMPEKDGFTFLEELRAVDQFINLPVIVITGKDLSQSELEQLHLHSAKLIKKSATLQNRLHEVISEALVRFESSD
ncbi:MAG: PAS domain S-box protein [Candidatus Marinimicrobia bacterium]|nr:PAS domain S-box protein [Candidatus Neomarinimicrobiota bacterium]MCF7829725.1 PAS domain S-box protein [Candidatus Neomarinimicrobiota bacterium]MCF7881675.1 PAS domain S-box protein [Candidatus Neomarinimicrobiota bacterium]